MKTFLLNTASRTLLMATFTTGLLVAHPAFAEDAASLNAAELKSIESNAPAGNAGKFDARPDRGVEGRIKHLHDQLKVMPDQEEGWSKVAQVMRDNAMHMKAAFEARENDTNRTAPEDIKSFSEMTQAHADSLDRFYDSFSTFYKTLNPAQQRNADKIFGHMEEHHEPKKM